MLISGDEFKGVEHFDNFEEAKSFVKTKRAEGYTVRPQPKFETFMGQRMLCDPPSIRVYYELK